jgi:signal-transduction protein with cAMP-binding, CBS, and nucleotidyltransferase domain
MSNIAGLLNGKNPQAFYNDLMNTNPQFRNFVNANQGKSLQQIAQENGIEYSLLQQFLR